MPYRNLGSSSIQTPRQIVYKYFDLIAKKDVRGILDLFTETEPVVYEPFSTEKEGLRGKDAIKSFLRVAVMANDGLERKIRIADDAAGRSGDTVTALVMFERGGTVQGRITFDFVTERAGAKEGTKGGDVKKIKSLRIRFI